MGSRARVLLPIAILTLVGLSAWRLWPRGPEVFSFKGPTMGTTFAITVVADHIDAAESEVLRAAIGDELEEMNRLMSNYRPDSEISRFNAHQSLDAFPLSAPMVEVLVISEEVSRLSGGAFDITIPPLLEAWGFGPHADPKRDPPTAAALEALGGRVGQDLLVLDRHAQTARKRHIKLQIDLSAIAPGYAADRLAALLSTRGYSRFMVDVGGEFSVLGHNQRGEAWRVGIERPTKTGTDAPVLQRVINLERGALATSGDYRTYREIDGRRISHTIDPRTQKPIAHGLASVTVIAENAARADALATALNVLGPEEGLVLAIEQALPVMMIIREGEGFTTRTTPAFDTLQSSADRATLKGVQ